MPEIEIKLVEAAGEICNDRSTWRGIENRPDTVTMRNMFALANYAMNHKKEWMVLQIKFLAPRLTQIEISKQVGCSQKEVSKILNSTFVFEVLPKPQWAELEDD